MSLNFPANPVEGQRYSSDGQTYVFRSGRWVALAYGEADELVREHQIPGRNLLINGDFQISQRGTSFSATGYTADRWVWSPRDGAGSVVPQTSETPNAPGYPLNYVIISQTTAATLISYFRQRIERVSTLAGKVATLSFWINADADTPFTAYAYQNYGAGGPAAREVLSEARIATPTWTYHTITFTVPEIDPATTIGDNNHLAFSFNFDAGLLFRVRIADVQLEEGGVATRFDRRHIATELALCQRYFVVAPGSGSILGGYTVNGSVERHDVEFPVQMRATPTLEITFSNPNGYDAATAAYHPSPAGFRTQIAGTATTGTSYYHYRWQADAEL